MLEIMASDDGNGWDNTFLWKMELAHQSLGGVTNGTWSVRCSELLIKPQEGLTRNLGLIFNPTHGSRAVSKVSSDLLDRRKPLTGSDLITPGNHTHG